MDLANRLRSNQALRKMEERRHLEAKGLTMDHVLNLYLPCLHRMTSHVLELGARLRNRA